MKRDRLWLAAMGSNKVAALSLADLEAGRYQPDLSQQIKITGGGPAGLAFHAKKELLFVYSRFANSISIIDTSDGIGKEVQSIPLTHNPEPQYISNKDGDFSL